MRRFRTERFFICYLSRMSRLISIQVRYWLLGPTNGKKVCYNRWMVLSLTYMSPGRVNPWALRPRYHMEGCRPHARCAWLSRFTLWCAAYATATGLSYISPLPRSLWTRLLRSPNVTLQYQPLHYTARISHAIPEVGEGQHRGAFHGRCDSGVIHLTVSAPRGRRRWPHFICWAYGGVC